MAVPGESRPIRVLVRNLLLATTLAIGLYVVFTILRHRFLFAFNEPETLLLEAGAVILVAYLVARALTGAANEVLTRRGQVSHGHAVRLFLNLLIAIGATFALFELAGVSAQSIFLGSAFAGIVLGLAAQTVLANVFAGLLLVVANPFHPGDRISLVSSSYGALAPSYPHEMLYPRYSGVVEDVGLIYTVIGLDSGGVAKVPNGVVITALILQTRATRSHRVRMTFPLATPVATVEAALADVAREFPPPSTASRPPRLEIADLAPATWDGVITVWSPALDEAGVQDRVMRAVLARLPGAPPATEKPRRPTP